LEKIQSEITAAKYETRLEEKTASTRQLEERRDALNSEFKSLNMQADSRARLVLHRNEGKTKTAEIASTFVALPDSRTHSIF
jgi:DNA repair protein RAD50